VADWTDGFFDDWYLDHFGFPDAAQTDVESEALRSLLPGPPARVLDLACGQGRHSIRLAMAGYEVVGLDSSPLFIDQARRASANAEVRVEFVEGDMRRVPFDTEFDAVLSLFTSWGFGDDATNQGVLRGVGRALRRGGLFVLEINNRDWILQNYVARDWQTGSDGTVVWIERRFDVVGGVNAVSHRWRGPDGEPMVRDHEVRFYTPPELTNMLGQAGMAPIGWYGGFSLEPLTHRSRRLLVTARKD